MKLNRNTQYAKGPSKFINSFSCMLIAYKRVGGCVVKTPIVDNFKVIDFSHFHSIFKAF